MFREFSPGFFDLIVIDECHRGSADEDSAWREILDYFSAATQIGMTATPKETEYVSNIAYFGEPVYSYSLKQGIRDGFLAPYKVVKVHIDRDVEGYRPEKGQLDREGEEVEDRIYNIKDFDRTLVLDDRTKLMREDYRVCERGGDRFQKTIVFCVDTNTPPECGRRSSMKTPIWSPRTTATSCVLLAMTRKARINSAISLTPNRSIPCWSPLRACFQQAWTRRPAG